MNISSVINETVSAIHLGEERKMDAARKLLPLKGKDFSLSVDGKAEKKLSYKVPQWVPQGMVAGVDSGFVAKRLATVDLVLIRAVGVVFDYSGGIVSSAKYFPNYFSFPEPHLASGSLEEDESEQSKSLMRLYEEVGTAKKVIELHSPKYLFIDGSIVPQYQDKPRKDSSLSKNYSRIISEFESLYSLAQQKGCTLIATVEDSRGSRFRQMLQDEVLFSGGVLEKQKLDGMFDSGLLDHFLETGERSCAFTYTKDISKHPVLQDFSEGWARSIYGLYAKPSDFDRPLRVEFICTGCSNGNLKAKADEAASVALALSSLHREYAFPSVLIEADMRARLKGEEIEIVYSRIMDKLGAAIKMKMRRENRPF